MTPLCVRRWSAEVLCFQATSRGRTSTVYRIHGHLSLLSRPLVILPREFCGRCIPLCQQVAGWLSRQQNHHCSNRLSERSEDRSLGDTAAVACVTAATPLSKTISRVLIINNTQLPVRCIYILRRQNHSHIMVVWLGFVRRPEDSLPAGVRPSDGPGDLPASVYLGEGLLPTDANLADSCGRLFLAGVCFWSRWARGVFFIM